MPSLPPHPTPLAPPPLASTEGSGRDLYFGRFTCFETGTEFPDIAWLRGEVQAGRIKAFGEMPPQFLGLAPNDSRLEPDLGTRRGIRHPGRHSLGPRTVRGSVRQSPMPRSHPDFRMAIGDPLLLEEVLLRHQRLRLSVMHAGWPRLESTLALLHAYPNVYVDTGGLHSDRILPRAAYYRYLNSLVEGGFGKRIMFGSDFPIRSRWGSTQSSRRSS